MKGAYEESIFPDADLILTRGRQHHSQLLGICFWREGLETAVGLDRPAGRSLLDLRSLGEGGGEDWRAGKGGESSNLRGDIQCALFFWKRFKRISFQAAQDADFVAFAIADVEIAG